MDFTNKKIQNSYGGILNIGAAGATGTSTLYQVTDGFGTLLPIEISQSEIKFTGTVTGITGIGGGGTGATGTGGVIALYGAFYDTTTQVNGGPTVANAMRFNNTDFSNGVSIQNLNEIVFTANGVFNIQFSAQFDKTDSGDDVVDIWLGKNGAPVPHSLTKMTLYGNNSKHVAAWNFLVEVVPGDRYQILWQSNDTQMRILAQPAQTNPVRPEIPSTILTISQVTYTQTGATGADGLPGATGAAGVTGATGSNFNAVITEIDGTPSFNIDTLFFPNGSIEGTTGGVLVNRFNGKRTITRSGFTGINPNTDNINEFLEAVFYPAVSPTLSLSATNSSRQFGSSTATTLTWSVTKQTRGISSITVNGNSITVPTTIDEDSDPFPTTVSNTVSASATQNVNTTFPMVIVDSVGNSFSTNATVSWFNKRYWGRSSNILPNDATIIAAVGGGSEFSTNRLQTRNGFDGAGNYLFFAWPSSFGTPTFTVNGLPNTAWTKQRSDAFVNSDGYSTTYDVWVSNTPQNSPLNIVVS